MPPSGVVDSDFFGSSLGASSRGFTRPPRPGGVFDAHPTHFYYRAIEEQRAIGSPKLERARVRENNETSGDHCRPGLARRASAFGQSVWSYVDTIVDSHPGIIFFGSGAPSDELYPRERLAWAAAQTFANPGPAFDYGELQGYEPLRELIAARMTRQGIAINADQLMITTGSQQGLDHVAKLFINPRDLLAVEAPTYIGALQAFDPYEPEYLAVPIDDDGLDVAELARALDRAGRSPKFLYTAPTFQNPTGITMTLPRRKALVALARERGFTILEDDPYGEIYFGDPPPPAIRTLDPETIYLGTFSKVLAPGIRVGWLTAPSDLLNRLMMIKEAVDIHGDRTITRTVYNASKDFLDEHVAESREVYRLRRDAMLTALTELMPDDVAWSHPDGGFFVWITLPPGVSGTKFLPYAADHGVAFLPGAWFYPKGQEQDNAIRLNFSRLNEAKIRLGIEKLSAALASYAQEMTMR